MWHDTLIIWGGVLKFFMRVWAPGDVAVAQVCVAHTLKGATIHDPLGLAGRIWATLLHFITSCNRKINKHTRQPWTYISVHSNPVLPGYISHQECRPWADHWSPRSSQRSTECSRRAAPTRSRCQQLWTCSSWKSHGRRSVSAAGKTDWRCLLGWILRGGRKRVNSCDCQDSTAKAGTEYLIQGWM